MINHITKFNGVELYVQLYIDVKVNADLINVLFSNVGKQMVENRTIHEFWIEQICFDFRF